MERDGLYLELRKGVLIVMARTRNEQKRRRLTWEEICRIYPNQQVGLADIERGSYDEILSAIVEYSEEDHTRSEINGIAARSEGRIYSENTTPRSILNVGVAVVNG